MTFLLTIPKCGHAVIAFISSFGWKRLCGGLSSFPGQGEHLPPPLPPCRALTSNQSHASAAPFSLGLAVTTQVHCSYSVGAFRTVLLCPVSSLGLKGAMSIMSRYDGAHRADENLFSLEFQASVIAPHVTRARQTHGKVSMLSNRAKKQILPL